MGFYEDMQEVASDVIDEFAQGTVYYVEKVAVAGGTADDPGEPTDDPTLIKAVVQPVQKSFVDGTHIVTTDEQITFAAGVVVPDMSGWFTVDGATLKIIEIMARPSAGTVVSYTVIVRR